MLEDIAILTGGQVITSDLGLELKDTTVEQLGRARQVKVQKENTIIVDGAGDPKEIQKRIASIKSQLKRRLPTLTEKNFRKDLQNLPAA